MNPIDDQLNRLFRGAKTTESVEVPPAFGLETRVMAAWRESRLSQLGMWDMGLLIRGLVVAILIMGVSFWPVLHKTTDPFSEYLQTSDTVLASDESP